MLDIAGKNVLIGGFHDHWFRNGTGNPTLLMAAMNFYHYDFTCLMDGQDKSRWFKEVVERWTPHLRIHLGLERGFGWGHVVTVYSRAPELPADDPDYRGVLSRLTADTDLVALAHPAFPVTKEKILLSGEIDRLLDDGCMHGVELGLSDEELAWFARRDKTGKRTPIMSGWDHHLIGPVRDLPPVLYGPRKPDGHLDSCRGLRTLIFAEENTWPAVVEAVKAGLTVIDDIDGGRLIGPSSLVEYLKKNGYRGTIKALDEKRDRMTLHVDRKPVAGEPLGMTFSSPGKVLMPGSLECPEEFQTDERGALRIEKLPVIMDRDMTHFPVAQTDETGYTRIWAVEVSHPIQLDVLPRVTEKSAAVEITPRIPFEGSVELRAPEILTGEVALTAGDLVVPLQEKDVPSKAIDYDFSARTETGAKRSQRGYVTFLRAPVFKGDWAESPAYEVAGQEYVGGYGANRLYPGADVFSVELRFAWTQEEFLFRARVVDPVHYQPFRGHHVYQADALQLALDPLLRRAPIMGSVYSFNLALTEDGPEVFRWIAPTEEATEEFTPPEENLSLGGKFLEIDRRPEGLDYNLRLPWSQLAPVRPRPGTRMGVYFLAKNNNGAGLIDSLQWPSPISGMWCAPSRWGVLTLLG